MSEKLYLMPSGKFPMLSGKPVLITEDDYLDCCCPCIWNCDDSYSETSGEIDLLERFPNIEYTGDSYKPYPNGVICLGPFASDVYIRHETDARCYYDDFFCGGIVDFDKCEMPPSIWAEYYPRLDGVHTVRDLANPLPAGSVYTFTIVSNKLTLVGVGKMVGSKGSYAKVVWSPV